jgi:uncharacterized membrane protein HdeD (DUF308 family)
MLELLRKSWWTISLRGVLITIFGILAIMDGQREISPADPVYNGFTIFVKLGLMFAISGGIQLFVGIAFRKRLKNWFLLVISSIPDIILCIVIFANGQQTTAFFGKVMGVWILIVGFALILAATRVKKVMRIILGILAVICILFGAFVELNEMTSLFIAYGTISYFTVLLGLVIFALGFSARRIGLGKAGKNITTTEALPSDNQDKP